MIAQQATIRARFSKQIMQTLADIGRQLIYGKGDHASLFSGIHCL
jgi:hypothetical protein